MIASEYTRAGDGATVDELLVVAGEKPVGEEFGPIRTNVRLYQTADRADKGRVNKIRERIVGAICQAAFSFKIEDLESAFSGLLGKQPVLAKAVWRIYDKTSCSSGVCKSGWCVDPHEKRFQQIGAAERD